MKKLLILIFLSLATGLSVSQNLRVHLKNGTSVSYSADEVDYVDFVGKDAGQDDPGTDPVYSLHNKEPYFSETVELMGLIFRLAGVSEYCGCKVTSVAESADSYFASMKTHQAVTLAKQYSKQNVRYDAVTGYGNMLIFNSSGEIIYDPDYQEGSNGSFDRWSQQAKTDMLVAVNDFYKASNFHEWFVSTEPEQKQAIASFKSECDFDYSWLDSFYGKKDKLASRIILSFMIGGHNNGIKLIRKDGTFLLTPTYGSLSTTNEGVRFGGDINLVAHEFNHPYCNPLISKYWDSISKKAEEVFNYKDISTLMANQAYGQPKTMMNETLVRSCAISYMRTHNQEDRVNQRVASEENGGFLLVKTIVKALKKYEEHSNQYASLDDFMPEIIDAINNYEFPVDPDSINHEYVDLDIEMGDGRKLYFATMNVGATAIEDVGSRIYRWGATEAGGAEWNPDTPGETWPVGHKLDAAHDIATIKWGPEWHIPSIDEWNLLLEYCDYERKEANECIYGVMGYFFYKKSDHNTFIFLPGATWTNEIEYWTSEITNPYKDHSSAREFNSYDGRIGCLGTAWISSTGFSVRPVCVK